MHLVGENPQKYIQNYSSDFQRDMVSLLRTAHGEKWIGANKFYNEYIRDKEHVVSLFQKDSTSQLTTT